MRAVISFIAVVFLLLCGASQGYGQASNAAPMICRIKGQIIRVLKTKEASGPCAKHPCRANVKVLESGECGPGIAFPVQEGDTVEMRFTLTLDPTAKVFKDMKTHFPGLKKGSIFIAYPEQ